MEGRQRRHRAGGMEPGVKEKLNLFGTLFILWLVWSGHYKPLLLTFGVLSCLGVVMLCRRLGILDREGLPLDLTWRTLRYVPWLAKEVVKSNLSLARLILSPRMPINPQIAELQASQKSDLGRVTYANSITLTPSTLTLDVTSDGIVTVHAISRESVDELREGEMDRRVTRVEGESED